MDLLERAQQLINQGNTTTQTQAHTAYLQTLSSQISPQSKIEVKAATPNNHKSSNFNAIYLISGLVLFGISVLAIGYWLGKRKKFAQMDEF